MELMSKDEKQAQEIIDASLDSETINDKPEVVLVVGWTGAGKSTFMSYISGYPCSAVYQNGNTVIISPESAFKISSRAVSETTKPAGWYLESAQLHFIDCPGFQDNRGVVQDIKNAFYLKNLFLDPTQTVRVVLVFEHAAIQGRL